MQVFVPPIVVPRSGVEQVPEVTLLAEPQLSVGVANLTSYLAGLPVPSFTSVNERVAEVDVVLAIERLLTVPGCVVIGGGVVPVVVNL